ncbi:Beta-1-4-N-acetylgalactosaminyltransferase bre-4 [Brachionus plicatilis]|uniref:Beta-1,4-galactosyltransferase n=1 Tax=Brachionus plicatilis TaxID=10195 RepID=A0A3M7QER9_BRAPC|nr:Beta-1-4-N-acetylgalactosaminyltransferase bre-4 [Brachionus plicatilis]
MKLHCQNMDNFTFSWIIFKLNCPEQVPRIQNYFEKNKSIQKKTSINNSIFESSNNTKTKCDISFINPHENVLIKTNFTQNFQPFQTEINYDRTEEDLSFMKNLNIGGQFEPKDCEPVSRVAIVIPYKNREHNLRMFLYNMHPFLQKQRLKYTIFVVEQVNSDKFNKGKVNNAAFIEIIQKSTKNFTLASDFECVVYHDVDLLPTSFLNFYTCPEKRPKHLSIIVGKSDYRIYYPILVGGVIFFRIENYVQVNGYSNRFWGWGAEDDDMFYRLRSTHLGFDRPKNNTVYKMLTHEKQKKNPLRVKLLREGKDKYQNDGLNSVNYCLKAIKSTQPIYTTLSQLSDFRKFPNFLLINNEIILIRI